MLGVIHEMLCYPGSGGDKGVGMLRNITVGH